MSCFDMIFFSCFTPGFSHSSHFGIRNIKWCYSYPSTNVAHFNQFQVRQLHKDTMETSVGNLFNQFRAQVNGLNESIEPRKSLLVLVFVTALGHSKYTTVLGLHVHNVVHALLKLCLQVQCNFSPIVNSDTLLRIEYILD